jgi:hypothetical protein
VIYLNLVLAGLRLGLKNRQVGEKWASYEQVAQYLLQSLSAVKQWVRHYKDEDIALALLRLVLDV